MGSQTPASDVPGAEFRARAVRTTQERRPDVDPRAIALSLTLARIAATHQHQSERLVHRERGWSYSGFRVLYMIWLTEPVEARDLARFAGVSRQTTSTVLSTLEAARLDEAIGAQNALESDWFSVLDSAEQAQLQDMLERVLTRIDRPAETPAAD